MVPESAAAASARRRSAATRARVGGAGGAGPDHPVRRQIYRHLLALPGDHFRSIARSLHLDVSTARHHLGALVRGGYVFREGGGGKARFYPVGRGSLEARNRLYMDHWKYRDLRLRVLIAVRGIPSAGPANVARALRISRQLAAYHLARLEAMGLVRRANGRYVPRD